jgi:hypothetical protein
MRTTLTLDDDLAGLLKQHAQQLGIPFKEAVNRAIRAGLGEAGADRRRPPPKTIPHSFGFMPGVDLDKLGQLADELEAEMCSASSFTRTTLIQRFTKGPGAGRTAACPGPRASGSPGRRFSASCASPPTEEWWRGRLRWATC